MVRQILCTGVLTLIVRVGSGAESLIEPDATPVIDSTSAVDWEQIIQPPVLADNAEQHLFFESFKEALANGSLDEAETTAKKMVGNANTDSKSHPFSRSRALHNLAVSQQLGGEIDAAILNYQTAIDIIVEEEDRLSSALVIPLRGLASAHLDNEQRMEAFRAVEHALHVSNVNHGPHNMQQLPILSSILKMYLDEDAAKPALKVLDRIYLLNLRNHRRNSEELLPALLQKAAVYDHLGMLIEERSTWRQVTRIIRDNRGENDIDLIEPNLQLAENFIGELHKVIFRSGPTAPTAEKYLLRALWLAENNPEVEWQLHKKCLLALADYYTLVDLHGRANRYYQQVWELLTSDDAYLATRAVDLEANVPLLRPRPNPYANFEYNREREKIAQDDYLDGEIVGQFRVNKRGRTSNIKIVEANPPDFARMERRLRNALKNFIYRPRFADGVVTETDNMQYRLEYYYLQSEYDASKANAGKLIRRRQPPTDP